MGKEGFVFLDHWRESTDRLIQIRRADFIFQKGINNHYETQIYLAFSSIAVRRSIRFTVLADSNSGVRRETADGDTRAAALDH